MEGDIQAWFDRWPVNSAEMTLDLGTSPSSGTCTLVDEDGSLEKELEKNPYGHWLTFRNDWDQKMIENLVVIHWEKEEGADPPKIKIQLKDWRFFWDRINITGEFNIPSDNLLNQPALLDGAVRFIDQKDGWPWYGMDVLHLAKEIISELLGMKGASWIPDALVRAERTGKQRPGNKWPKYNDPIRSAGKDGIKPYMPLSIKWFRTPLNQAINDILEPINHEIALKANGKIEIVKKGNPIAKSKFSNIEKAYQNFLKNKTGGINKAPLPYWIHVVGNNFLIQEPPVSWIPVCEDLENKIRPLFEKDQHKDAKKWKLQSIEKIWKISREDITKGVNKEHFWKNLIGEEKSKKMEKCVFRWFCHPEYSPIIKGYTYHNLKKTPAILKRIDSAKYPSLGAKFKDIYIKAWQIVKKPDKHTYEEKEIEEPKDWTMDYDLLVLKIKGKNWSTGLEEDTAKLLKSQFEAKEIGPEVTFAFEWREFEYKTPDKKLSVMNPFGFMKRVPNAKLGSSPSGKGLETELLVRVPDLVPLLIDKIWINEERLEFLSKEIAERVAESLLNQQKWSYEYATYLDVDPDGWITSVSWNVSYGTRININLEFSADRLSPSMKRKLKEDQWEQMQWFIRMREKEEYSVRPKGRLGKYSYSPGEAQSVADLALSSWNHTGLIGIHDTTGLPKGNLFYIDGQPRGGSIPDHLDSVQFCQVTNKDFVFGNHTIDRVGPIWCEEPPETPKKGLKNTLLVRTWFTPNEDILDPERTRVWEKSLPLGHWYNWVNIDTDLIYTGLKEGKLKCTGQIKLKPKKTSSPDNPVITPTSYFLQRKGRPDCSVYSSVIEGPWFCTKSYPWNSSWHTYAGGKVGHPSYGTSSAEYADSLPFYKEAVTNLYQGKTYPAEKANCPKSKYSPLGTKDLRAEQTLNYKPSRDNYAGDWSCFKNWLDLPEFAYMIYPFPEDFFADKDGWRRLEATAYEGLYYCELARKHDAFNCFYPLVQEAYDLTEPLPPILHKSLTKYEDLSLTDHLAYLTMKLTEVVIHHNTFVRLMSREHTRMGEHFYPDRDSPVSPYPGQIWFDTTNFKIFRRNWSNTSWQEFSPEVQAFDDVYYTSVSRSKLNVDIDSGTLVWRLKNYDMTVQWWNGASYVDIAKFDGTTGFLDGHIAVDYITGATYKTLQHFIDTAQSAGHIGTITVTDNGDGTVNIGAGTGFIRSSDSNVANNLFFDWAGDASYTPAGDPDLNYIYINYNAGAPIIQDTTDPTTINFNDEFPIARVYKDGNTICIVQGGQPAGNIAHMTNRRFAAADIAKRTAGSILSETGARNIAVTAGSWYAGLNFLLTAAFDSSGADRFSYWYNDHTGWVEVATQSQVDNTQWNDYGQNPGLVALTANRYGVHWVYQGWSGDVGIVYGQGDYKLAEALGVQPPSTLPDRLTKLATLIGKIIIQKNSATFYSTESAFVTVFVGTGVSDHGDLAGLQGGTVAEYYHLTSAQHTELTDWIDNNVTLYSDGGFKIEPTATGSQTIVAITSQNPLDAGSLWAGIIIDATALDPVTGANCAIAGCYVDFSTLVSVDKDAILSGFWVAPSATDTTTGFGLFLEEMTENKIQTGFSYTDPGSTALSATATYRGVNIDWSGTTRNGGAPVLEGISCKLPASYTDFGTSWAGYFSGDGRSVTICDTTYALDVADGRVRILNLTVDTTTTYRGFENQHTKTAGITDHDDHMYGILNNITMNHASTEVGDVYGIHNTMQLDKSVSVGDAVNTKEAAGIRSIARLLSGTVHDSLYGTSVQVDGDGGTVSVNVCGSYVDVDLESAMASIAGDVYGQYIKVDADKDPTGSVYMLYLDEATNVDYGIYQAGTGADNYLKGQLGLGAETTPDATIHSALAAADNIHLFDCYSDTDTQKSLFLFRKSHHDTYGTMIDTIDGEWFGVIGFKGVDTNQAWAYGAYILAEQDGNAGADYVPTKITIKTSNTGLVDTTAMTIGKDGVITAPTFKGEGAINGWINFDGTGVIAERDSYNVAGIADNAVGEYTVTWDIDFANDDYAVGGAGYTDQATYNAVVIVRTLNTEWVEFQTLNVAGPAKVDSAQIFIIAIGDSA